MPLETYYSFLPYIVLFRSISSNFTTVPRIALCDGGRQPQFDIHQFCQMIQKQQPECELHIWANSRLCRDDFHWDSLHAIQSLFHMPWKRNNFFPLFHFAWRWVILLYVRVRDIDNAMGYLREIRLFASFFLVPERCTTYLLPTYATHEMMSWIKQKIMGRINGYASLYNIYRRMEILWVKGDEEVIRFR